MAEIGVMKKLTIGGPTYTIPEYSLPIASASTLGGVKIGTGLSINSTTGVLSATGLDFDEADPVFTASPAGSITQEDINNWNSKTSNPGTVTSVRVQASDPLQSSVSAAQSNTLDTTISFKNQNKNLVLAGPSTGNATAPTFRLLVADDIPISDWAKATSKPSYNFSEIGLKPTTLSGYGITDAYTKTQVDGLVAGVLHYKGTKASVANLPTTNNVVGDVWHITADGSEYAWDGSIWQELGTSIDLSGYALKSELPTDTNTWRTIQVNDSDILGSEITTGKLNLKAGNVITLSESSGTVTFNHSDTSSQASSSNSGRTYIQSITLDTYGHVTGISTATETVTNTDQKVKVAALTSGTTYYPILATGTGTATRQIDSTLSGLKYISTAGSTSTVGTAILQLGNSTASGSSNNEQGVLRVYTINTRYVDVKTESTFTPTGSRNRYLPSYDADMYLTGTNTTNAVGGATTAPVYVDNTGCIQAVTSIPYSLLTGTPTIPTVPTKVSAFTNDAGYITSADVPEGASAYTGTISAVTSGNASAGSNNGFARGDHVHNITKTTITNALGYTPADILIGNTRNVTPTQVLTALQAGKTVYITHEVDTDLTIYATYFDYANTLSIIVSSILVEVSGVYYVYILTGNISTNTWSVSNTALAKNSSIPTVTNSNTTGITASTTATKTTLGTASSIYGVKSGTNSTTTASKASGSNGSASNWVFEDVTCDDITAWSAGSGSASFSATVSSHVLSFSHSHTHTAPTLTYSGKTASHVKSGGNGTAPSWSFTDVTVPIRADSATSVPNVSVASATVSITDPGHTHTI